MNKIKNERDLKKNAAAAPVAKASDGGWRETVEQIAMAVILALLFRGFVAEAFVIPTGSMAPTLQGRHKDVECPKCQARYQTSGSEEQSDDVPTGKHVYTTTCPICRYTQTLDPVNNPNEGSFSGDRIIVGKFPYDFAEPERWDVIVFKYPGNAAVNYIKRLIGLPGETVRIVGGNIYVQGKDEPEMHIARKPPHKLTALLQLVDDTNHIPAELVELGWPTRWQNAGGSAGSWESQNSGRAFVCKGGNDEEAWLRYRHLVPSHADWETIELKHQLPAGVAERPGQLITDFYAYNTPRYMTSNTGSGSVRRNRFGRVLQTYAPPTDIEQHPGPGDPPPLESFGQHWVDDVAVECLAEVTSQTGELSLLLVRGGNRHVCKINLADGKATLSITKADGAPLAFDRRDAAAASPTADTSLKGPGNYRLRLSNCDHEMLLWVNGSLVTFDRSTAYDLGEDDDLVTPAYTAADSGDLAPAGVASKKAAVKLSQLRIYRDKYYIASTGTGTDYNAAFDAQRIQEIFQDPSQWASSGMFAGDNRRFVEFDLEEDQFMPLGDNSPQSYDARYWAFGYDEHHYVERDLLIGKALLIYWPHTWNRPIPYTPNFSKMGPIQ